VIIYELMIQFFACSIGAVTVIGIIWFRKIY